MIENPIFAVKLSSTHQPAPFPCPSSSSNPQRMALTPTLTLHLSLSRIRRATQQAETKHLAGKKWYMDSGDILST